MGKKMVVEDKSRQVIKVFDGLKRRGKKGIAEAWMRNVVREINTIGKIIPTNQLTAGGAIDTGEMLRSNITDITKRGVMVGNTVDHSVFVTMGTFRMQRRPFFQNSLTNYTDDYRRILFVSLKDLEKRRR